VRTATLFRTNRRAIHFRSGSSTKRCTASDSTSSAATYAHRWEALPQPGDEARGEEEDGDVEDVRRVAGATEGHRRSGGGRGGEVLVAVPLGEDEAREDEEDVHGEVPGGELSR